MSSGLPSDWIGRIVPGPPGQPAAQQFSQDAPEVHIIKIPLDAANVRRELSITGNVLWIINASSPTATARFHLNRSDSDGFPVSLGMAFRTPPFQKVFVENTAQAGQFLEVVYFVSQYDFFVVNPSIATPTTSLSKPTSGGNVRISIAAAGVNNQIVPADATRRAVIVKNEGPDNVRVGWLSTPVTDTLGIQIAVGESITLEGTQELDARVATGGAVPTVLNAITVND